MDSADTPLSKWPRFQLKMSKNIYKMSCEWIHPFPPNKIVTIGTDCDFFEKFQCKIVDLKGTILKSFPIGDPSHRQFAIENTLLFILERIKMTNQISVYDLETGKIVHSFRPKGLAQTLFIVSLPKKLSLVIGLDKGTVIIVDFQQGSFKESFRFKHPTKSFHIASAQLSGNFVYFSFPNHISICNLETGKLVFDKVFSSCSRFSFVDDSTIITHGSSKHVTCAYFSQDKQELLKSKSISLEKAPLFQTVYNNRLYLCTKDKQVLVYDILQWKLVKKIQQNRALSQVCFSNGKVFCIQSGGNLAIFT